MPNDDYREQHERDRAAGLAARHETRVERAIRRQVAEEIAQAILQSDSWIMHPDYAQVLIPRAVVLGIVRETGSKETP